MRKALFIVFISMLIVAAKAECQQLIKIKSSAENGKVTGICISNNRYGDGIRRGMTAVDITIQNEDGNILTIAADRCDLKSMKDDKGGKLDEEAKQDAFGTAIAWYVLGISANGKSAAARAQVFALPTIGATKLSAAGKLAYTVGRKKALSKAEKFEFINGGKVKVGDTTLVLQSIEKSEDKKTTSITFQYEDLPRRIIDIEFLDDKGDIIEKTAYELSIIAVQPDGKGSAKITCKLNGDISKADLRITYWQETEDITTSFDSTVGLGLTK
jgi:hypothetical protein